MTHTYCGIGSIGLRFARSERIRTNRDVTLQIRLLSCVVAPMSRPVFLSCLIRPKPKSIR